MHVKIKLNKYMIREIEVDGIRVCNSVIYFYNKSNEIIDKICLLHIELIEIT